MVKTNLKLLLFCLGLSQLVFATKYAGDFEGMGVSARAIGLGGAYVAVTADPSAIYYNPANSIMAKEHSVLLMHAESFSGMVKNNYLGIVLPTATQSFGLGILNNGIPGIKLTTLPDTNQLPSDSNQPFSDRTVNASHWVFYLNGARQITSAFRLGLNLKIIYQTYGIASCFGLGVDLGSSVTLAPGLDLGIRIRNLTSSPLFWDNKTKENIAPRAAIGLDRTFNFGRDHLLLTAELENNFDNGFDNLQLSENFGLEYSIKQILAARLGLYHRLITLGLGINYKRLFIDYAYQTGYFNQSRELGSSQKISGGIKF